MTNTEVKWTDKAQAWASIFGLLFLIANFWWLTRDNKEFKQQLNEMKRQSSYLSNYIECQIDQNAILEKALGIEQGKLKQQIMDKRKAAIPSISMILGNSSYQASTKMKKYSFNLYNNGGDAFGLTMSIYEENYNSVINLAKQDLNYNEFLVIDLDSRTIPMVNFNFHLEFHDSYKRYYQQEFYFKNDSITNVPAIRTSD